MARHHQIQDTHYRSSRHLVFADFLDPERFDGLGFAETGDGTAFITQSYKG